MCTGKLANRIIDPARLLTNPSTAPYADPLGVTKTKWGDPTGQFRSMYRDKETADAQAADEAQRKRLAAASGAYARPTMLTPNQPRAGTLLGQTSG